MKTLIVIPARLASTRLPDKLLLDETGQPLIQHTYQAAADSALADEIIVAADDKRIVQTVTAFGGNACLTSRDHQSGTDRLAEVALDRPDVDLFINVQGDEPEIDHRDIDQAARLLLEPNQGTAADMATLAIPLFDQRRIEDPSCVKVVFDQRGRALYFSRSVIPFPRTVPRNRPNAHSQSAPWKPDSPTYYQHVGLYVYRRDTLLELSAANQPVIETTESLEQLRALYLGKSIQVGITTRASRGIDTADDYRAFVSRMTSC